MPHVHISGIEAVKIALVVTIYLAVLRVVELKWPDSSVGKALSFIH
jgi:hypothetical protein